MTDFLLAGNILIFSLFSNIFLYISFISSLFYMSWFMRLDFPALETPKAEIIYLGCIYSLCLKSFSSYLLLLGKAKLVIFSSSPFELSKTDFLTGMLSLILFWIVFNFFFHSFWMSSISRSFSSSFCLVEALWVSSSICLASLSALRKAISFLSFCSRVYYFFSILMDYLIVLSLLLTLMMVDNCNLS